MKLKKRFSQYLIPVISGLLLYASLPDKLNAATFFLSASNRDLIGQIQTLKVQKSETFFDIARRYDLGFNEITAANPNVDPWLPEAGSRIIIPTLFILPIERRGIVVNIAEMRLYYFHDSRHGKVVTTFPVGIGQEGFATPLGTFKIKEKIAKPSWTAPESIISAYAAKGITVPKVMPPGPDNPLGDFAILLNKPGYLLHGTNTPYSVGMRVSHGCLRLYPEDIQELVKLAPRGTKISIINQPVKLGRDNNKALYIEAHQLLTEHENRNHNLLSMAADLAQLYQTQLSPKDWDKVKLATSKPLGIPVIITQENHSFP